MTEPISPEEEMALADRLKQEAWASQPEFSEALHERICQAIEDTATLAPRHAATSLRRPRMAYAAAAAVCVVGVPLLAWRLSVALAPQALPPELAPAVVHAPEAPDELLAQNIPPSHLLAIDAGRSMQDWADLQHDARMATQMLIDQLPLEMTSPAEQP